MLGLIIRTIYILFGSCYIFCDSFGKAFLLFLGQAFTILPRCCMVPFIYITSLHLLVHIFLSCIFWYQDLMVLTIVIVSSSTRVRVILESTSPGFIPF